ncbi:MAG TPA: Crp/Fnr family transcriptional regulator, partial [Segetibacter sp.]
MPDAFEQLRKITSAIQPLSQQEMDAFVSAFTEYTIKKKQLLTIPDKKEQYLYFVTEGVQRIYSTDDNEREATILFTYPYSFGGVLDSFMLQNPSRYFYEALSASSFLRVTYIELEQIRTRFPAIEQMLSKGLSLALSGVLERLAEIQSLSAEEKLKKLFNRSPHIFQLI